MIPTVQAQPTVLYLDNFLSAAECAHLIKLSRHIGFRGSITVDAENSVQVVSCFKSRLLRSALRDQGVVGAHSTSTHRTSSSSMCDASCERDGVVAQVLFIRMLFCVFTIVPATR